MKYTFEVTIAGCATNCAHCYVDGGPAPQMKLSDYEFCIQKIKPVLDRLGGDVAVTLGNEIFCHGAINDILSNFEILFISGLSCADDWYSAC